MNSREVFTDAEIQAVWKKDTEPDSKDEFRKDECGTLIKRSEYKKETKYGWNAICINLPDSFILGESVDHDQILGAFTNEITSIHRVSEEDSNKISNYKPLHWKNCQNQMR